MADTIEQAQRYMERDRQALQEAGDILYNNVINSSLMSTPPTSIEDYDSKRQQIITELTRVRAYLRDVIGDSN